jgi:hypothetical protein
MNHDIKRSVLITLATLWLAACSSGGSDESTRQTNETGSSAGIPGCTDRSSAVGIEGGGLVRRVGRLDSIDSNGTLVVGCQRIFAGGATVLIAGQPGTLNDLHVGAVVEVVGTINPDSGVLQAQSISAKAISTQGLDGRYIGTVTIGDQQLFGDALITVDGAVRLYIGGPYSPSGALQTTRPAGASAQFVGHLVTAGSPSGSATGVILGQGCTNPDVTRFCTEAANSDMTFTIRRVTGAAIDANLDGTLHVTTSAGEEGWVLDLGRWSNYYLSSTSSENYDAVPWREELAEFASGDDTIITFAGLEVQFQSANSGCTGNGTFTPHLDGAFGVFDVVLDIGNCNATYARFNGRFEGLSSDTPGSVWDYDVLLRLWVSKVDGSEPVALTMLASPIY